uniref:Uncharacterized protein n=1 Tax=Chromera velia CCMP2878 TaxID=1169474 RepID=A0A0G4HU41_9ALVE|eukprot:Cvel_8590.t1-p1 / transcript=Cvel_8590.t1 / gene=Cvel_8590 / organism=Chromera_velia_CCMP2878 / gene_product=hypothetical protein / transcript_product=hypothetical protein / location=Cvel_scaffold476:78453-78776(-) / protein_length=108 / sequence_SO=supercontig / SO=protein_coding / is_pseudo=false
MGTGQAYEPAPPPQPRPLGAGGGAHGQPGQPIEIDESLKDLSRPQSQKPGNDTSPFTPPPQQEHRRGPADNSKRQERREERERDRHSNRSEQQVPPLPLPLTGGSSQM